jgi:hypothetical protein
VAIVGRGESLRGGHRSIAIRRQCNSILQAAHQAAFGDHAKFYRENCNDWVRRLADIADRGLERLNWAGRASRRFVVRAVSPKYLGLTSA